MWIPHWLIVFSLSQQPHLLFCFLLFFLILSPVLQISNCYSNIAKLYKYLNLSLDKRISNWITNKENMVDIPCDVLTLIQIAWRIRNKSSTNFLFYLDECSTQIFTSGLVGIFFNAKNNFPLSKTPFSWAVYRQSHPKFTKQIWG